MFEEPLLGGKSRKSAGHEQHLQQYLYPNDGDRKQRPVDEQPVDLHVVIHQLNSFFAVLWPVCITMICAR